MPRPTKSLIEYTPTLDEALRDKALRLGLDFVSMRTISIWKVTVLLCTAAHIYRTVLVSVPEATPVGELDDALYDAGVIALEREAQEVAELRAKLQEVAK